MRKIFLLTVLFLSGIVSFGQLTPAEISTIYKTKAASFGLTEADIRDFKITSQYKDRSAGLTHIYLRQVVNGIEIFDANSSIHIDSKGNIIAFNNAFIPLVTDRTNASTPQLRPAQALQKVASEIGMQIPAAMSKMPDQLIDNQVMMVSESVSPEPVKVKLYYTASQGGLMLCWNVTVFDKDHNDWWNTRVDALTGETIDKNNWVVKCGSAVHAHQEKRDVDAVSPLLKTGDEGSFSKAGEGSYNILPMPLESPLHGSRAIVSGSATANASPYGWHDIDGIAGPDYTITRGNNVYACEDSLGIDEPGYSPDGGADLVFDYNYSDKAMPALNVNAAITNLFYWNNLIHDVFYNYGFDEPSGNFQSNNYGKGGAGSDAVFADAQDGSGTNNANFAAPEDGENARMQMYLWDAKSNGTPTGNFVVTGAAVNGAYSAIAAAFGPKLYASFSAKLAMADAGGTNPTLGCDTFLNDMTGKVALIYRGTCNFPVKIVNAQLAGAIAVIVVNNSNANPYAMTAFTGTGDVKVPSFMISKTLGDQLKAALTNDSNIVVTLVFDSTRRQYDSDLDNGVITHEYGHGISNRLTGGPANANCLTNQEQAGEGWSDFFALCLTAKVTDSSLAGRGMGTWLNDEATTGVGIRTYRYTRNMKVNPSTYNSIKTLAVPHGVGSVLCTMLYDAYWDMVDKYGFNSNIYENATGGNNMMLQLVIDGLKLQPCNPGFVDARDAILKADSLRNGGANKALLWKAFARRGLGYSASQGLASSRTDGTEAFDLPPNIFPTGNESVNSLSDIKMAPNPAQSEVFLILPDQVASLEVSLYDLQGRIVMSNNLVNDGSSRIKLDLNGIGKGIYLIRAANGKQAFQSKLVIN